jgi:tetratricopeptide (TPR) repeat protein
MSDTSARRPGGARSGGGYSMWAIAVGLLAGTAVAVAWFVLQHGGPRMGAPDQAEAAACLSDGDLDCAEADYRAWLAKHPDDAGANAQLALALSRDGKDKEALPYFQRAVQLGPVTYGFDETYAASLRKVGDLDGAIRLDQAALDLRPMLKDLRARLADELAARGRYAEAIALLASFDKAQTDNYNHPVFTAQIARLRAQMPQQAARPTTP